VPLTFTTDACHAPQEQPGCTVVQASRFQGRSIGATVVSTSGIASTFDSSFVFALSLRCCAQCSALFPEAQAYFVCVNTSGCRESRDQVRFRPAGACECQLQERFERGLDPLGPGQLDSPTSFSAGVIIKNKAPFVPAANAAAAASDVGSNSTRQQQQQMKSSPPPKG
jgi:hypothetical protein